MSVTTPILRDGFWAKLGAGLLLGAADAGADEAGAVEAGGATVGAGVEGATVAALEHAETIRANTANKPRPLERMRIVPPQTRGAVRVRCRLLPMDRDCRRSSRIRKARPLVAS
ncbi:MAG TPA: hypothetical protein VKR24_13290 [Candidatus Limnocylindrales bacterium]|nr:hypothetical protein [Candidatus Limnocylindrales bacterium]